MSGRYTITRKIEIDAAHRVPTHGSKCFNLHGHRYAIEATCESRQLHNQGEQSGMVVDFGFLKDAMLAVIHDGCDHGTIISTDDEALTNMLLGEAHQTSAKVSIQHKGYSARMGYAGFKVYVVPFIPTAENLAKHWFERLAPLARSLSHGMAELTAVKVWETPNCAAVYTPEVVS